MTDTRTAERSGTKKNEAWTVVNVKPAASGHRW
jgi:hypothetical protein